ncbi:MAG: peptidase M14 [Nitrospinaceae bacterium]|nr:peptidase M14 [Nitrospinaceae bacterium]NIR53568.1 peptidase M14 [Nitrospinaceae bacterium]NIS83969.1 peptidase M14 [Nitrospinaceae bacterium]NIT80778.1 peptidase M14 [Nitrospinaceae bacterium]NIU43084.1 peptidase M14 [Nitrospinaceae bacterium]
MDFYILDELPEGMLEAGTENLHEILDGPTLLRIPGKKEPALFVSTLLHGDEPTGFLATQKLLNEYRARKEALPRTLWLFLGNIPAARENQRHLPGQPDFNRIWNGGSRPEHRLAENLTALLRSSELFAAIDIHNTSGRNPHYACVNKLDPAIINLGKLFSSMIVYFTRPEEVISRALSEFCTAITIESGLAHDPYGVEHVSNFLRQCLNLDRIPDTLPNPEEPEVYHSIARIEVPETSRIGFGDTPGETDFNFVENLESMNFIEQAENTLLGWRRNPQMHLAVVNEQGQDVSESFIHYKNGEIRLLRCVVPSMFTTHTINILDDCLGYLMQRYTLG